MGRRGIVSKEHSLDRQSPDFYEKVPPSSTPLDIGENDFGADEKRVVIHNRYYKVSG